MDTTEKQESQKTVVAFVAGLLIGGLLVWVFSSSPEDRGITAPNSDASEEVLQDGEGMVVGESEHARSAPKMADVTITSDATIVVSDQPAGTEVVLDGAAFPMAGGWIVVREYTDTLSGNILGAARFEINAGLIPKSVELLRGTEAGSTYQVIFFTEDGDMIFDTALDLEIGGVSAVFMAQ